MADGDSLFRVNRSKLKVYFSIWFFRKSDKYLFKVKNSCCEYGTLGFKYDRVLDKPGHYRTFFSDANESGFPWA